jgi:cell division septation protein DedD
MTTVEQLVGDLLLRHNCVIIPSFGGFVAKQVSATIDYSSGKMMPPRKSLLFNKQLINNDGLLVNELSQANSITFNEASQEVTTKVDTWNATLNAGGRIELDRIGILFQDEEKNLCFEQDRFFNLLLESFGLGQVQFVAEKEAKVIERKLVPEPVETVIVAKMSAKEEPILEVVRDTPLIVAINKDQSVEKETVIASPRKRTKVWRYVAAACFLPIAFYSIWIPMKTDMLESGVISFNDFNPFHKTTEAKYSKSELDDLTSEVERSPTLQEQVETLPAEVDVYAYEYDEDFTIPVAVPEKENAPNNTEPTPTTNESFTPSVVHYIVGSFGEKANASKLVNKLNAAGLDAKIIGMHDGHHRVSAGSAMSIEKLQSIKDTVSNLGHKGWVLK